jgi:hypothetical protein
VSKIYDATNRDSVDVKWRALEFTELPSSALKYCGLLQQEQPLGKPLSSGQRIAKLRAQVARHSCGLVRTVAIRSQVDAYVCGNPQYGYFILGNPRCKFERGT